MTLNTVDANETPTPVHERPSDRPLGFAHIDDLPEDTRRGGSLRILLGPRTVQARSGFTGVATIQPGDRIAEHYHPYSEEFIYVISGTLTAELDGFPYKLRQGGGVLVPPGTRHRLRNVGTDEVFLVFHLGPLAPRPELGHVDTEETG